MNKRIIMTSIFALCVACPSYADIAGNENNPSCDNATIGATSGTTSLEAIWNVVTVTCNPGTYLDKTTAQCVACPVNQYCPGGDFTVEMSNTGNNMCSTLGDGSYTLTGGTNQFSANQCYKTSSLTCSTYNPYSGSNSAKVTSVTYGNAQNGSTSCTTYYGTSGLCAINNSNACNITDITCATGYHKETVQTAFERKDELQLQLWQQNTADLLQAWSLGTGTAAWKAIDGTTCSLNNGVLANEAVTCYYSGTSSPNPAGLNNGEIVMVQDNVLYAAEAMCTSTPGTSTTDNSNGSDEAQHYVYNNDAQPYGSFSENSTGNYCWCRMKFGVDMTTFTPQPAYSDWLYVPMVGGSSCATNCAGECLHLANLTDNSFKNAMAATIGGTNVPTSLQCIANTINIDWDPANGGTHTTNSCLYDGAVTLPAQPSKTGYTFGGWSVKTQQQ